MKDNRDSGLGYGSVVQIVFIILKLTGLIDWPWLWVLSPLWIGLLAAAVLILIAIVVSLINEDG